MLRNCYKIAYCGLISLILTCCQSTKPLLSKSSEISFEEDSLIVVEGNSDKFQIESKLKSLLSAYNFDFNKYKVKIELSETEEPAAFTGKQIVKEQLRIASRVTLYDKDFTEISTKVLDSFTTYEVSDTLPYSALSSKRQSRKAVIDDLVNSLVFQIIEMMQDKD